MPTCKVHRHIGMSGQAFVRMLAREAGTRKQLDIQRMEKNHDAEFNKLHLEVLPGAIELLEHLQRTRIGWAIATTGGREQTDRLLQKLQIPRPAVVITGDDVKQAKPAPDVFVLAAQMMRVPISDCIVIGDSPWDVLAAARKRALGVGLLTGGYSHEELESAGAFRVYSDPNDLLVHIEDLGIPGE